MALFGESEEEKKIREQAEAKQRNYEANTGEKVPEEPGIEPDEITMGAVDAISGAGPVRAIAGHGVSYLGNQVKKDAKGRLAAMKEKMPAAVTKEAPLFYEAKAAGTTAQPFHEHIRPQPKSMVNQVEKPLATRGPERAGDYIPIAPKTESKLFTDELKQWKAQPGPKYTVGKGIKVRE